MWRTKKLLVLRLPAALYLQKRTIDLLFRGKYQDPPFCVDITNVQFLRAHDIWFNKLQKKNVIGIGVILRSHFFVVRKSPPLKQKVTTIKMNLKVWKEWKFWIVCFLTFPSILCNFLTRTFPTKLQLLYCTVSVRCRLTADIYFNCGCLEAEMLWKTWKKRRKNKNRNRWVMIFLKTITELDR